jgi:hypothetical protein
VELALRVPTRRAARAHRLLHAATAPRRRRAGNLLDLARRHPAIAAEVAAERPALRAIPQSLDALRLALERERFAAIDADARRIEAYLAAAEALQRAWPALEAQLEALPLRAAHALVVGCAEQCLPTSAIATGS